MANKVHVGEVFERSMLFDLLREVYEVVMLFSLYLIRDHT
jgi:hypothetical protein